MVSNSIVRLCEAINSAGGRALLVGGWVRDHFRGVPDKGDYDVEVYGLGAERLKSLLASFGPVNAVGEAFTVHKLQLEDADGSGGRIVVDVSLPRRESKTGRGHRGFTVVGDSEMSPDEAARRRDFTINAIMFDPISNEFIDPFSGRDDIERRVLRAVDPTTFIDDSLRVLRAMQFASRFEYVIDASTIELCRTIDLADLPAERVWGEVEKWLLLSPRPSIGWWAALELGVVDQLWPEIKALLGCPQDPEWHPEGDVFIHTGMVIDEARKLVDDLTRPKQIAVMLGALCHDFGKPPTTRMEDGRIRSRGHDAAGVPVTEMFLDRFKLHTLDGYDVRASVMALVANHLTPVQYYRARLGSDAASDGAFRRLALRVEPDLLYRVARADCLGRTGDFEALAEEWFLERVRTLAIEKQAPAPILMGRHLLELGLSAGPRVGEVAREVYELQLDGKVDSLDGAIAAAKEILKSN